MEERERSLLSNPQVELFPNIGIRKNLSKAVKQFWKLPAFIKRSLSLDECEQTLYRFFKSQPKCKPYHHRVLVQRMENKFYLGVFGQIALALREQSGVRVEQFIYRSQNVGELESIFDFLKSRFFINPIEGFKWKRLYNSFCDGVGYSSTSFDPLGDLVDFFRALKKWRKLQKRDELTAFTIDDVLVGDLINDSYIRFKAAPTLDLRDTFLLMSIWQAYRDIRRAKKYFSRYKPSLYLAPWSVYIQHGISVRVALLQGIKVFTLGNGIDFSKELATDDWLHTRNTDHYANDFSKLANKEEKLAIAETALSSRIRGEIDSAISAVRISPYNSLVQEIPNVEGAAVIFLHEFIDNPHCYKDMVFPDFWEWTCFTIDALMEIGAKFYIKPHPASEPFSEKAIEDLKKRYPGIGILATTTNNKKLRDSGMACTISYCGSVIHEMAYLGVPTIACNGHPHTSFDFCYTARTKEEYRELIKNFRSFKVDKEKMRRQSLEFYYMHNFNITEEEQDLRALFHRIYNKSHTQDSKASGEELKSDFGRLSGLPAFKSHITEWIDGLNGKTSQPLT